MKKIFSLLLSFTFLLIIIPAESSESKAEEIREIAICSSVGEANRKQVRFIIKRHQSTKFKHSIQNTPSKLHSSSDQAQAEIKSTFPPIFLLKHVFII